MKARVIVLATLGMILTLLVPYSVTIPTILPQSVPVPSKGLSGSANAGTVSSPTHSTARLTPRDTKAESLEFVGQLGGTTETVTVAGDYAYAGEGPRLTVIDVSNPQSLAVVGRTSPMSDIVEDAIVRGKYAYLAADCAGLFVVDISDAARPVVVGRYDSYNLCSNALALSGDYAYLSDHTDLWIIDISVPSTPVVVSVFDYPNTATEIAIEGDYLYVIESGGLRILDVSVPDQPVETSFIPTPELASDVAVANGYAYVTDYQPGLHIIDVSVPSNPVIVSSYEPNEPGAARTVAVSDGVAHVGVWDSAPWEGRLWILDVSNPGAPARMGSYGPLLGLAQLVPDRDNVYVAAEGFGVRVIDLSSPSNATEIGSYDPPSPSSVTVSEGHAYLGDHYSLVAVNISDPSRPEISSIFPVDGWISDISVKDKYGYIATSTAGVQVIDVSDPSLPIPVGGLDESSDYRAIAASIEDWVSAADYSQLKIVDVSEPSRPEVVGLLDSYDNRDLAASTSYVYAAAGDHGLRVIDISEPAAPVEEGVYDTSGTARAVESAGDLVYLCGYDLEVVDVSIPSQPQGIGTSSRSCHDVAVNGDYAYTAEGSICVYDVHDPSSPAFLDCYRTAGGGGKIAVDGDYVYVADGGGGLVILQSMVSESTYSVSGYVKNADGIPLRDVTVLAGPTESATTDASGAYTITGLVSGTHSLTPRKSGWTFTPLTRTVSVPPDATGQEFVGYPCVGPSGLDVCSLQAGDIILSRSPSWYSPIFSIGGTYFTHAMMYIGFSADPGGDPNDIGPRLAEAQGPVDPESDQVWETWLTERRIWTGSGVIDWAVVRPSLGQSTKAAAVTYARHKAAEEGVVFDLYADREDDKRFYCSKLVWRSYRDVPDGRDLEANRGIGSELFDYWVTPDDLYFSSPEVDSADLDLASGGRFMTRLWSPAHITLVDAQGRRTGYDATTGEAVFEIPGADYYAPPDAEVETITAVGVQKGWQIIVTGYNSGEYRLESMYMDKETLVSVEHATTESGQVDVYDVQDPTYVVYLPLAVR